MSPQRNTIVRPQAESNRRAQVCRLLPSPLDHGSLVRRDGFEPPCPWDLVYSQAQSSTLPPTLGVPYGIRTRQSLAHNQVPQPLGSRHQSARQVSNLRPPPCESGAPPN